MKLASFLSIDVGFAELPIYRQNVCIGSMDSDLFLIRGCRETRSSDYGLKNCLVEAPRCRDRPAETARISL